MTIKLIVGLANPGMQYARTRHNIGHWFVEKLLLSLNGCNSLTEEKRFFGYSGQVILDEELVRVLVPATFMNCSGTSVSAMASFYRLDPKEILVAHDELDIPPGKIRIKFGGRHGGHNGLKDIIKKLGNNPNFYRLRIGIGHPGDKNKVVSFVLDPPTSIEKNMIYNALNQAVHCLQILLQQQKYIERSGS